MARIRMIKPEFFDDPEVGELTPDAALFFIGLWTQADREGRLEDDMRRLKARIFPYRAVDVEALAVELHGKDMIRRYQDSNGNGYIWVRNFVKHQRPHPKEPASVIPSCECAAVEKHGEPRKETAKPSESGFLILDSGTRIRKLEDGPRIAAAPPVSLSSASRDPFTDPAITERAGRFIERYEDLYPKHRNGARYSVRPTRDYAAAVTLCTTWKDDARLDKLAICFLTTDHKFAAEGSRTIPQFLALASWADGELAEWEKKQARA